MASRNVNIDDFVPYRPDDIGIIIPHASMYPQRWKWFWPNFMTFHTRSCVKKQRRGLSSEQGT